MRAGQVGAAPALQVEGTRDARAPPHSAGSLGGLGEVRGCVCWADEDGVTRSFGNLGSCWDFTLGVTERCLGLRAWPLSRSWGRRGVTGSLPCLWLLGGGGQGLRDWQRQACRPTWGWAGKQLTSLSSPREWPGPGPPDAHLPPKSRAPHARGAEPPGGSVSRGPRERVWEQRGRAVGTHLPLGNLRYP